MTRFVSGSYVPAEEEQLVISSIHTDRKGLEVNWKSQVRSDMQPPATNNASKPHVSVYVMALSSAQVGAVVVGGCSCREITPRKLLVVPDENEPHDVQLYL